ncbi:MAG: DUF927 domain-containing protein [Rhodocyclaceae bacterium]|nr:DUF927 domain-containing protein [Rhodocyclaceae bacterium]
MKKSDIQRIAEAAKGHGQSILDRWLPGGKRQGKEYVVRNPNRDDAHVGSLSVEIASGKGGDFATSETFGDFVGLVAFADKCSMSEAAEVLAEFLRMPANAASPAPTSSSKKKHTKPPRWTPILPVPKEAPPPPAAHPTLGKPKSVFHYRDAAGQTLGYVYRWEATEKREKTFRPLTYGSAFGATHSPMWDFLTWDKPRPLYGLDRLAARPAAAVILYEGEKSAEAGTRIAPDYVNMCWPNGANAADKADCGPLAGRGVLLWADHDEPGRTAMQTAAKALKKAGARLVRFISIAVFEKFTISAGGRIVERLQPLPSGWDAADAEAEGWTKELLDELLKKDDAIIESVDAGATAPAEDETPGAPPAGARSGSYLLDPELGLHYIEKSKDDEGKERLVRLCGPLSVPALGRDAEGGSWGPVLEFLDRDGLRRREVISFQRFIGEGHDGVKQLADLGLEIASGRQTLDRLKAYIVGARTERRARLVDQTGWHGRAFVFPDGAIGENDETLLFRSNRRALGSYATRGSLSDWQTNIAHWANGNPHLMFCLCTALTGPLLKPLGASSVIFHLEGDSSIGKSGAQHAAGSVWGPQEAQVHTWRATSNALEFTAAQHNDMLLCLDELKEVDPKEVDAVVYMLSNQRGKGRAHHAGGLRESTSWRIIGLSSGEMGLADHLASVGKKPYAGQQVRFIGIAADANAGLGMWHTIRGMLDGGKGFTETLKKNAARYYGTAGRAFVAELVKHQDEVPRLWRSHDLAFSEDYKPANAGGQVLRVLSAFSLAAFAGTLAAKWGIVPWAEQDVIAAAGGLFEEWLKERPTKGNAEEAQIISHVRSVLERTWQSKFVDWARTTEDKADLSRMSAVHDSLGFRKRDVPFDECSPSYLFYVTRQRFVEEFAAKGGFKHKRVASLLKARGVLVCDADSTTLRETLPNGDPRSYCISGTKLWALDA